MDRDRALFWTVLVATLAAQLYALSDTERWFSWPAGDIILHIAYGATMFLFFVVFLRWHPTDALLGVLAWQVLWEASEMIDDRITRDTGIHIDHLFFDGIKDTFMNIAGGLLGWVLWYPVRTRELFERRLARLRLWVYLLSVTALPMIVIGSIWYAYTGVSHNEFAVTWFLITVPLATVAAKFLPFSVRRERRTHKSKPITS